MRSQPNHLAGDQSLVGQTLSGVIVLDYNLYSCHPTDSTNCSDPVEEVNAANNSFDFFVTADAEVMVAPEPSTAGPMCAVLPAVGLAVFRRRRRGAGQREA